MFPKLRIVLVEPEIPSNTGSIGRSCVGLECELHLVGKLGFEINDKQLRRAGLDYWKHLKWYQHATFEDWMSRVENPSRVFLFTTKTNRTFFDVRYELGDWLVFGKETKGLSESQKSQFPEQLVTLPMTGPIRSLNLSNAVTAAMFEGLRQLEFSPTRKTP